MKLTAMSNDLNDALAVVKPSIAKRTHLPILNTFVLEAKAGGFLIAGTNLEQTAHRFVGSGIDAYGATCVPAKEFADYLKLVPKGVPVALERDWRRESLTITFGSSRATIRCMHAADYPVLPGVFDSKIYEEVREQERGALEKEEEERLAALPEDFEYYRMRNGERGTGSEHFDTLEDALTAWATDDSEGNGNGYWIKDIKRGKVVVANVEEMRTLYNAYMAKGATRCVHCDDTATHLDGEGNPSCGDCNAEEDTDDGADELTADFLMNHAAREGDVEGYNEAVAFDAYTLAGMAAAKEARHSIALDGQTWSTERIGPPPGIPCNDCDAPAFCEAEATCAVTGGHFSDIPVTFSPSSPHEYPIQQQEQLQHDARAEMVAKATKAAIAATSKPSRPPKATKLRFGYTPPTIEKFFQRAMKQGAEVRYAKVAKHNGALVAATPIAIDGDAFLMGINGTVTPEAMSEIKYLEYLG
jgi:hypothetical protein